MKKVISKATGALAIIAIVAVSSANKVNAQPVKMDDVNINTAENFEAVLQSDPTWTFVSKHYVYKGTQK